jgi:hypothetical protein
LEARATFKMSEFKKTITAHFNKSVDFILLDARNISKTGKEEVKQFIQTNHPEDVKRLITIGLD